jgi:heme/copper-type cytochrome/quinol oxidase subunit 1
MKRLVLVGLLLGMVNGLVAALALYLVHRASPDAAYGWFAYAPLNENVVYDYYGFPWQYVVVPAVLVVLNALLLPLAVRRAWLRG